MPWTCLILCPLPFWSKWGVRKRAVKHIFVFIDEKAGEALSCEERRREVSDGGPKLPQMRRGGEGLIIHKKKMMTY